MNDADLQQKRFLAMGIDAGIFIGLLIIVIAISLITAVGEFAALEATGTSVFGTIISLLISVFLYLLLMAFILLRDYIFKGNSIGKHLMKIRLVKTDGTPLNFMSSVKRNCLFAVPTIFILMITIISAVIKYIPVINVVASCLFFILYILMALAAIGFVIWEIVNIVNTPDGIRWGDKFGGTQVVK